MGFDKFKKSIFGGENQEEREYEEERETPSIPVNPVPTRGLGGIENNKMILFEPRAYSESQQIANYLKSNNAVIVNLKRVTPDQAKRIVDFLYGTIYAIGGDLQKLGGGIFLCTPKNVNVEGTISEDNAANAKANNKKKDGKEEEEDFF